MFNFQQNLMIMEQSDIIEYYPVNFKTDLNGKQHDWEAVVLIPFIDEVCAVWCHLLFMFRCFSHNKVPLNCGCLWSLTYMYMYLCHFCLISNFLFSPVINGVMVNNVHSFVTSVSS